MFLLWLRGKYNSRGLRVPKWTVTNPPFKASPEHELWMAENGYTCQCCLLMGGVGEDEAYRSYAESYLEPLSGPEGLTDRFAVLCPECHSPVERGPKLGKYDSILDLNAEKP